MKQRAFGLSFDMENIMGYKRTSKKTGATTRRTHTINTNGAETYSHSQGTRNFRMTYSNNSKTGNKVTQTYRDGAGFTHTRTVYKSPTAKKKKKTNSPIASWLALGVLVFFAILYLK